MTRLFVNNEEVAVPPPSFASLEQVIRHVEQNLLPPDAVIRQVNLDGLPVDAGNSDHNPAAILGDLSSRERVEITTCTLKEIAQDSIKEAGLYLERVESLTPSLAISFREGPAPASFEDLKQLYDGFYWMSLLLDRLEAVFGINLDQTRVDGILLRDHHQRFISVLKQLVAAQEQEDFGLIADLLDFEVLPMVPVWKSLFANIARPAVSKE